MKRQLVFLATLFVMMTSCLSTKVVTEIPFESSRYDKVALMPVLIGRIDQPVLPLIDASAFNNKTNKISTEIMDYQEKLVYDLQANVLKEIKNRFGTSVADWKDYASERQIDQLKNKFDHRTSLLIDHDHYPKIISTSSDANFFNFEKGNVEKYFDLPANFVTVGREVCKELGTDAVAVCYSKLAVVGIGVFGSSAQIRLETFLYIIDKNGILRGYTKGFTKPLQIKGKNLEDYMKTWNQYPELVELVIGDIINRTS